MDSWERQAEAAKREAKRPFAEKHPQLTTAFAVILALAFFGGVLWLLNYLLG